MENFNLLSFELQRPMKFAMLRSIRDSILNETDWITSYRIKEDIAFNIGLIKDKDRRWDVAQMTAYLMWCKQMCDLPEYYKTDNRIDLIMIEQIKKDNLELFPACPLLTELSSL